MFLGLINSGEVWNCLLMQVWGKFWEKSEFMLFVGLSDLFFGWIGCYYVIEVSKSYYTIHVFIWWTISQVWNLLVFLCGLRQILAARSHYQAPMASSYLYLQYGGFLATCHFESLAYASKKFSIKAGSTLQKIFHIKPKDGKQWDPLSFWIAMIVYNRHILWG